MVSEKSWSSLFTQGSSKYHFKSRMDDRAVLDTTHYQPWKAQSLPMCWTSIYGLCYYLTGESWDLWYTLLPNERYKRGNCHLLVRVTGYEIYHSSAICSDDQSCHQDDLTRGLMDLLQDGGCTFWGFELLSVTAMMGGSRKGCGGRSTSASPIRGFVAIPTALTGFERSVDHALTCAFLHSAPVSRGTLQHFMHHAETSNKFPDICTPELSPHTRVLKTCRRKAAQRTEQHVPARVGNGTSEKSATKVTHSHPHIKTSAQP